MYLYDKFLDNIYIYETKINKEKIIEYKKKHLEDIKSIILHIKDSKTEDFLFWNDKIYFDELEKLDDNTNEIINYIELTHKREIIDKYVNGLFDNYSPIYIVGAYLKKEFLKSNIKSDNYTLLFNGGVRTNSCFISNDSILLSGKLAYEQQLIYGDINRIDYMDSYLIDDEFIKAINCDLIKIINYNDINFLKKLGIITLDVSIDDKLDKSYNILKLIK